MRKEVKKNIFVYPRLPGIYDLGIMRLRGAGLANCLFVASRAYLIAEKYGWVLINPTWQNLILGPYLRNEKDKRHYIGLFKNIGISGVKKILILLTRPKTTVEDAIEGKQGKIIVAGLENYFEDLLSEQPKVKRFIYSIIQDKVLSNLQNTDFRNAVGVHVRLGDYSDFRVSIDWYAEVIRYVIGIKGKGQNFLLFSDGSDSELDVLTSIPQVRRICFGNALSDIVALSRCKFIIGSDSTFSAWASFLEQTPIIFPRRHFGRVLLDSKRELVWSGNTEDIKSLVQYNDL